MSLYSNFRIVKIFQIGIFKNTTSNPRSKIHKTKKLRIHTQTCVQIKKTHKRKSYKFKKHQQTTRHETVARKRHKTSNSISQKETEHNTSIAEGRRTERHSPPPFSSRWSARAIGRLVPGRDKRLFRGWQSVCVLWPSGCSAPVVRMGRAPPPPPPCRDAAAKCRCPTAGTTPGTTTARYTSSTTTRGTPPGSTPGTGRPGGGAVWRVTWRGPLARAL